MNNEQRQCGAWSGVVNTQIFFTNTHPPVGQKTSHINFKHKITTLANYTDGIGTQYTYHDKEMFQHSKRLKNYFKINQSN